MDPVKESREVVSYYNFDEKPLSDEIWISIFSRLKSSEQIVFLGLTNRLFNRIYSDNHLWKPFLSKHFPYFTEEKDSKNSRMLEQYQHCKKIEDNIKNGFCTTTKLEFSFIDNSGGSFQIFANSLFKSCPAPNDLIEVFDLTTKKRLAEFHTEMTISCLHVHENSLFIGGKCFTSPDAVLTNNVIKIWDLKTLKPLDTIDTLAKDVINCLCVQGDDLFVGVKNRVIILDLKSRSIKKEISTAGLYVISLRVHENILFTKLGGRGVYFKLCDFRIQNPKFEKIKIRHYPIRFGLWGNSLMGISQNFDYFTSVFTVVDIRTMRLFSVFTKKECFDSLEDENAGEFFHISNGRFFKQYKENKIHVLDFNSISQITKEL